MGTNKVENVSKESVNSEWKDFLTINLKMRASDAFKPIPLKPE
jgi:hypothetical protein